MTSKPKGFVVSSYVPPSLDSASLSPDKETKESTSGYVPPTTSYIKKDGVGETKKANTLTLGDYLTEKLKAITPKAEKPEKPEKTSASGFKISGYKPPSGFIPSVGLVSEPPKREMFPSKSSSFYDSSKSSFSSSREDKRDDKKDDKREIFTDDKPKIKIEEEALIIEDDDEEFTLDTERLSLEKFVKNDFYLILRDLGANETQVDALYRKYLDEEESKLEDEKLKGKSGSKKKDSHKKEKLIEANKKEKEDRLINDDKSKLTYYHSLSTISTETLDEIKNFKTDYGRDRIKFKLLNLAYEKDKDDILCNLTFNY
jgi:hypothetical protein